MALPPATRRDYIQANALPLSRMQGSLPAAPLQLILAARPPPFACTPECKIMKPDPKSSLDFVFILLFILLCITDLLSTPTVTLALPCSRFHDFKLREAPSCRKKLSCESSLQNSRRSLNLLFHPHQVPGNLATMVNDEYALRQTLSRRISRYILAIYGASIPKPLA